jgi:hypothetical protein
MEPLSTVAEKTSIAPFIPPSTEVTLAAVAEYPIPYLWFMLVLIVAIGLFVLVEYSSGLYNASCWALWS